MDNLIQDTAKDKRQYLIDELIKSGVYKKDNKHLYEWTLNDLETEFNNLKERAGNQAETINNHHTKQ